MKGPGQFLGRFAANLEAGTADIWSNDISQAALDQRKGEETQEIARWADKKTASKWDNEGPTDAQVEGIVKAQRDSVPRLLSDLVDTLKSGSYNGDYSAIQEKSAGGFCVRAVSRAKPVWIGICSRSMKRLPVASGRSTASDLANFIELHR